MEAWNPECAVYEHELKEASKRGHIVELHVNHSTEGFYVTAKLEYRDEEIYLTTRRDRDRPKYYVDPGRLLNHIIRELPEVVYVQAYLLPRKKNKGA
ncbi:MAG: hypothetical protein LBG78_07070 [Azoarcus sp.]|jgi:hypothetical protein|nr:hypothetical protein [Azoarcus sp.]